MTNAKGRTVLTQQQCLSLLSLLSLAASLRALWTTIPLVLNLERANSGTAIYNLIFAIGIWWVLRAFKRLPNPELGS